MPKKPGTRRATKPAVVLRASVSFPPDIYRMLEQIAKQKKVSVAWVVRDAAEQYVAQNESKKHE